MTREEAIEWIENIKEKYIRGGDEEFDEKRKTALDMAIKALKQNESAEEWYKLFVEKLEQKSCSDVVSRAYIEPIIEELENICVNGDEHILNLLADIKNAPPVNPRPKTGHWIYKYHEVFKYYCDKCGTGSDLRTQYCPNCGCKMLEP